MRIAIVGAGLAGLALCYHLVQKTDVEVTLFDAKGIGGGASGASTGLLHPFLGKKALLSEQGKEALEESLTHLTSLETKSSSPLSLRCGIFRPAITEEQRSDFQKSVYPDLSEWRLDQQFGPGLWIPKGTVVFSRPYLTSLWTYLQQAGVQFIQDKITTLQSLQNFDRIAVTAGADILEIQECSSLHVRKVKGQALLCRFSRDIPFALASHGHIAPTQNKGYYLVGSTYERKFQDILPDKEVARLLLDQVAEFYPPVKEFAVVDVFAGVRLFQPNSHLPLIQTLNPKTVVFTALGSRGLLYHHFFAKKVAKIITSSD